MKTTIEVKGFEIVIDETDDNLTITATKDGEVVEEFELSISETGSDFEEEEVQDFDEFENDDEMESEDGEDEMQSEDDEDEMQSEDGEDEMQSEDEEEGEDEVKLESFQSFINKRR